MSSVLVYCMEVMTLEEIYKSLDNHSSLYEESHDILPKNIKEMLIS